MPAAGVFLDRAPARRGRPMRFSCASSPVARRARIRRASARAYNQPRFDHQPARRGLAASSPPLSRRGTGARRSGDAAPAEAPRRSTSRSRARARAPSTGGARARVRPRLGGEEAANAGSGGRAVARAAAAVAAQVIAFGSGRRHVVGAVALVGFVHRLRRRVRHVAVAFAMTPVAASATPSAPAALAVAILRRSPLARARRPASARRRPVRRRPRRPSVVARLRRRVVGAGQPAARRSRGPRSGRDHVRARAVRAAGAAGAVRRDSSRSPYSDCSRGLHLVGRVDLVR